MARIRRPSPQATALVLSFAREPARWRYGYELSQELGIKPGSMYPILMRLADRGFLETTWESEPEPGRPPRHLYRLTGAGRALAGELAAERAAVPAGEPAGARPRRGGTPAARPTPRSGPITGPAGATP